jgi:hypothetical protein
VFLPAVLISHGFTVASLSGVIPVELPPGWTTLWSIAALFYFAQSAVAVSLQERSFGNYFLGAASWLFYAPLYVPVALVALWQAGGDAVLRRRPTWDKTPRTIEP